MLHWIYLYSAIVLEVIGTVNIKFSDGFTKLVPSLIVVITYLASFYLLSLSMKKIEVSTSYAIWSALGTFLIAGVGVYLFKESLNLVKVVSLMLIIVGVIGLNLAGRFE